MNEKLKKFNGVKNLAVHFFFTKGITEISIGIARGECPVLVGPIRECP